MCNTRSNGRTRLDLNELRLERGCKLYSTQLSGQSFIGKVGFTEPEIGQSVFVAVYGVKGKKR